MRNIARRFSSISINIIVLLMAVLCASAQMQDAPTSERIAISARPAADSMTLRWAPLNYKTWRAGNTNGYRVERYALMRNGALLPRPEKSILHPSIHPVPEAEWESLVKTDKYAAIAAQALFGDRFEIDLKQSDVFSIVNKVRENEQRFAFALFSADMSPVVAKACGLWFVDKTVKEGEKYLYRVVINTLDSLRGSIFIGPDQPYFLSPPRELKAKFEGQIVSLKWHKDHSSLYTAYVLERSEDGRIFHPLSSSPMVTVSPTEEDDTQYEYAIDSVKDLSATYYYRVFGITPFGERSPASNVVSGTTTRPVSQAPYISTIDNLDNSKLILHWTFPEADSNAIAGFQIERSSSAKAAFLSLTENLIRPRERSFTDNDPGLVNYYRVTAHGLDGQLYPSHIFFAQLIDSIPPTAPAGLQSWVSDEGTVTLSWQPNSEKDMYGYRVYMSYHKSEELAQITAAPIATSSFIDSVNLNTLNEKIYYSVMAIDKNQNHSDLSALLEVTLPDVVAPQRPVFHSVESDSVGVFLHWIRGGSEDIVQYQLYRKIEQKAEWKHVTTIDAKTDSAYHYLDKNAAVGKPCCYTIVALDEAGLESVPASPVCGIKSASLLPAITWKKPKINREENNITLGWMHRLPNVQSFKIYRSVDQQKPILFGIVKGNQSELQDTMIPGRSYRYRIISLFEDGNKSLLSEELEFRY
jgi:uncharacterized protein